MVKTPPARAELIHGFTLVEVLAAVTLLAILGILAWRGLESVRQSNEHVSGLTERWQTISRAIEHIGRSTRQPSNRPGRRPGGADAPAFWGRSPANLQPDTSLLVLTRRNHLQGDDVRLGYFWHDQKLELLTWSTPESINLPQGRHLLLEGVERLAWRYLDDKGLWHDSWPPDTVPSEKTKDHSRLGHPRAITLDINLAEGIRIQRIFDLP